MITISQKRQLLLIELAGLFLLIIVIPFFNGTQIWPGDYGSTFSLVFINILILPSLILFYRWFLPFTIGRKRYVLFILLLPLYFVVYEINARLSGIITLHVPFIPERYKSRLAMGLPDKFGPGHYIHQTLVYTFLLLLSVTSIYIARRAYKNQHRLYLLENDKLKLELNQLKRQLQPHFFFNTLNNLYALSTQGSSKTSPMIASLSEIMRYVLYESEQEKVPLQNEIDFIRNYIALERIRHSDADIDLEVQGDPHQQEIEPLLFLSLIENAFKHCLACTIPGKYVRMALMVEEKELIFQIENPYIENDASSSGSGEGGIGLKNLKKRLGLLYPASHQLDIDRSSGIFTVFLMIRTRS